MNEQKVIWLAGFVDGEGMIACYESQRKGRNTKAFDCNVVITNSDLDNIVECDAILIEMLGHSVIRYKETNRKNLCWHLQVSNRRDIIKLLAAIEPYLIGKKSQAKLLLEILKKHQPRNPTTKMEWQIVEILKKMKQEKKMPVDGNAELSRESFDSRKCVEHIEATTQSEMNLS